MSKDEFKFLVNKDLEYIYEAYLKIQNLMEIGNKHFEEEDVLEIMNEQAFSFDELKMREKELNINA